MLYWVRVCRGPTMAVIALKCPNLKVTVIDSDEEKIKKWNGQINNLPVYEPGLKEIIEKKSETSISILLIK